MDNQSDLSESSESSPILQIETPRAYLPLLQPSRYKGAHGGRGCVHPDTMIDTPNGAIKVSEFNGGQVYSWDNGRIVVANATAAYPCTVEDLFEVTLDNGSSIIVTDEHKFLTDSGWKTLSSLDCGDVVQIPQKRFSSSLPESSSGISLLKLRKDAQSLMKKLSNFLGSCFLCFRQYGQQLQTAKDIGLFSPQLQGDAGRHNFRALSHTDGPKLFDKYSLSSAFGLSSNRFSRIDEELLYCEAKGNYISGTYFERLSGSCSGIQRFLCCNIHFQPFLLFLRQCEAFCTLKGLIGSLQKLFYMPLRIFLGKVASGQSYCCLNDSYRDFHYSTIRLIRKHSRQMYWDLHVFKTNNYLAQGFVNHNSGKSHFFAEAVIERCIMEKTDVVCIREVQKSLAQSVKRLLEIKIEALGVGHLFDVLQTEIRGKNGSLIIFQGMQNHTADSIKSLEGFDVAWVEEAQSLSQRSLDLLRPTIRKPGSELWFSWNPEHETDPVDALLRTGTPPPNSIVIEVNYYDNPWFPAELQAEMEYDKARDLEKYNHVWLGQYKKISEALVFRNWKVEEFEMPEGTVFRLGADWGFATDPSVLVRASIDGKRLYIDYEAYGVGVDIDFLPDLFMTVPESEKWPICADSARPETVSYMQRHGFPKIHPAIKGAKSIEDGIEFLKSFEIIVHPRCKHTIYELGAYSYKTDPLTGHVLPVLEDKDNHVIDALRYACESVRRTVRPNSDRQKVQRVVRSHGWMG